MDKKIALEQVNEWAQGPINQTLTQYIRRYIEELQVGLDAYTPYQPHKTQEILANLNGSVDTWEAVIEILNGDFSLLEEDNEYIGDSPEG